jgi:hypothetical protein
VYDDEEKALPDGFQPVIFAISVLHLYHLNPECVCICACVRSCAAFLGRWLHSSDPVPLEARCVCAGARLPVPECRPLRTGAGGVDASVINEHGNPKYKYYYASTEQVQRALVRLVYFAFLEWCVFGCACFYKLPACVSARAHVCRVCVCVCVCVLPSSQPRRCRVTQIVDSMSRVLANSAEL